MHILKGDRGGSGGHKLLCIRLVLQGVGGGAVSWGAVSPVECSGQFRTDSWQRAAGHGGARDEADNDVSWCCIGVCRQHEVILLTRELTWIWGLLANRSNRFSRSIMEVCRDL